MIEIIHLTSHAKKTTTIVHLPMTVVHLLMIVVHLLTMLKMRRNVVVIVVHMMGMRRKKRNKEGIILIVDQGVGHLNNVRMSQRNALLVLPPSLKKRLRINYTFCGLYYATTFFIMHTLLL